MLSLTDICKNCSLHLSWTFAVLTSFVRLKQALLCILFWPCRKNPNSLFVWNCWKSLKVFFLCKYILASYTITVSLLESQTWVTKCFYYQPCADCPVTNSLMLCFGWTISRHITAMILIDCFLLQFMITSKESLSMELDTSSTHSSSVVPWVAVTPQLTAKLISFLVNRDGCFLVLPLPEFIQPALCFMLGFICAIYFVVTPEFWSSSSLTEGEHLLLCPLSMNSHHLLSNKIVLLDSGNHTSN